MKIPSKNSLSFHVLIAIGGTIALLLVMMLILRLFTRHGSEFEIPSFIGQNAQELTQSGKAEGFVFEISDYQFEKDAVPGNVLKQDPAPGEKVKKGRKVYLTVAADEPPTIKMPELHDMSLRQAQIILENQGLILENVIEKPSPYENAVLYVLYKGHNITTGTEIKMGEKITLVIGKNIGDLPDEESETETSTEQ